PRRRRRPDGSGPAPWSAPGRRRTPRRRPCSRRPAARRRPGRRGRGGLGWVRRSLVSPWTWRGSAPRPAATVPERCGTAPHLDRPPRVGRADRLPRPALVEPRDLIERGHDLAQAGELAAVELGELGEDPLPD